MTSFRRAVGVPIAVLALVAPAAAAAPNTWSPVFPMPGATTVDDRVLSAPGGALLRYGKAGGAPQLTPLGADGPGTPVTPTGATSSGTPGPVAFLPDGGAIVSYYEFNTGPLRVVYRFPDGHFGAFLKADSSAFHTQALAVRAGEVLLVGESYFNGKQLSAYSLSIGGDGTLTSTGPPVVIFQAAAGESPQLSVPVAALAADAQAEVAFGIDHVEDSRGEMVRVHRAADGQWASPQTLKDDVDVNGAMFANGAVAPGGRAVLAFHDKYNLLHDELWTSVREPAGTFAPPERQALVDGPGGALIQHRVAAGPDGTLGIGINDFTCQTQQMTEVRHIGLRAIISTPGKPFDSYGVSAFSTKNSTSRMTAFGAAGGRALVGVRDEALTSGTDNNTCANPPLNNNEGVVGARAAMVGEEVSAPDITFGNGSFAGSGNGSVQLYVDAAGMGGTGDAAVTGRLAESAKPSTAFFTGPGVAATPTPAPTGSATPTATVKPAASATPTPTPPPAPVNTPSATPTLSTSSVGGDGKLKVQLKAPLLLPGETLGEQLALQVFAGRRSAALAKKAKPVGTVTKRVTLTSGQRKVVTLRLTKKLRRYLKQHRSAKLVLRVTSTQAGHRKTVTTRAVKRRG